MTIKATGVYRQRCEVHGPNGSATVMRLDGDGLRERYAVHHAATPNSISLLVATCWRYGPPAEEETCGLCPHIRHIGRECPLPDCRCRSGALLRPVAPDVDGGWVRALAIAEDVTLGNATHCYREG